MEAIGSPQLNGLPFNGDARPSVKGSGFGSPTLLVPFAFLTVLVRSCTPGRAHTPLKSGFPLARRGAGAFMSTLVRADCAAAIGDIATASPIAHRAFFTIELLPQSRTPVGRGLKSRGDYLPALGRWFNPPRDRAVTRDR